MRHKVTISGDDADEVLAYLRTVGADLDVDIADQTEPSLNPLDDIVFYLDRLSAHALRSSSTPRYLRAIDTKLFRIASSLERIAEAQERMARIEQDRRDEEILRLRK